MYGLRLRHDTIFGHGGIGRGKLPFFGFGNLGFRVSLVDDLVLVLARSDSRRRTHRSVGAVVCQPVRRAVC